MRTAVVAALMVLSGVLAGRTSDSIAVSTVVRMEGESFAPETITVDVGDTVTWVNDGLGGHNARATDGTFRSPNLSGGATFSFTFAVAGTFDYLCTIHPSNMTGRVVVRGAAAATATPAPPTATATSAPPTATATAARASATVPTTGSTATRTPEPSAATVTSTPTSMATATALATRTATISNSPSATSSPAGRATSNAAAEPSPRPPGAGTADDGGRPWRVVVAIGGFAALAAGSWLALRGRISR